MAVVVVNTPNFLKFKGSTPDDAKNEVIFEFGEYQLADGKTRKGIDVVVDGEVCPLLTATAARKLAKWLNTAADELEGVPNKNKKKNYHAADEDDDDMYNYKIK